MSKIPYDKYKKLSELTKTKFKKIDDAPMQMPIWGLDELIYLFKLIDHAYSATLTHTMDGITVASCYTHIRDEVMRVEDKFKVSLAQETKSVEPFTLNLLTKEEWKLLDYGFNFYASLEYKKSNLVEQKLIEKIQKKLEEAQ